MMRALYALLVLSFIAWIWLLVLGPPPTCERFGEHGECLRWSK